MRRRKRERETAKENRERKRGTREGKEGGMGRKIMWRMKGRVESEARREKGRKGEWEGGAGERSGAGRVGVQ